MYTLLTQMGKSIQYQSIHLIADFSLKWLFSKGGKESNNEAIPTKKKFYSFDKLSISKTKSWYGMDIIISFIFTLCLGPDEKVCKSYSLCC